VHSLDYSAYPELAVKEGQRILDEALKRWPLDAVRAAHRVGSLALGEAAVLVEVASGHRGEGFEACRWIIDEIKARVPLWKNEHFSDSTTTAS
jgi:molybdopterin synthase catalytic subunit